MASFSADVVIYGATAGGVLAAKVVSMRGKTCIIIDPGTHVGGLVTGGLSATDVGPTGWSNKFGGQTLVFYRRLSALYGLGSTPLFNAEPKVCQTAINELTAMSGITLHLGKTLTKVNKTGPVITSIVAGGDTFTGARFIDATYELDLGQLAGVTSAYGREGFSTYRESAASAYAGGRIGFGSNVGEAAGSGRDSNGQLLKMVGPSPKTSILPGDAYASVQAMNFRLCLTNTPANRQAFTAPAGYSAADYAVVANYLAATPAIVKLVGTPEETNRVLGGFALQTSDGSNKWDCNRGSDLSTNFMGPGFGQAQAHWAYGTGSAAMRLEFAQRVYKWIAGLLYWLANDAGSPAALKADAVQYGYCNDEFQSDYFGMPGFPPSLYVRSARRLVGQYVMTLDDIKEGATHTDPIFRWGYPPDTHPHQSYPSVTPTQRVQEGGLNAPGVNYYQVPFRSILPGRGQADNLLVPVCFSTSQHGWASLRMEPAFMMAGEAAGAAACVSIDEAVQPVRLPYAKLRPALTALNAVL